MAKRFTDTGKWKKEFIKGLTPKMKLLWFYILDDCDHAGMWEVDMEVASLRIGEQITYEEAFIALGSKLQVFGRNKWFIEDFVAFQYGKLSANNRMHQSVIATLTKYKIPLNMGLISPFEGAKVKEQEQDKDKVKEKDKDTDPILIVSRETIDEKLSSALDEIYISNQRMNWREIDFDLELFAFVEKVRGSPDDYINRDTGGIRTAFIYQLRNAKKKQPNGKSFNKNDRTEFNQNELAIIAAHANSGGGS